jgi:transposase
MKFTEDELVTKRDEAKRLYLDGLTISAVAEQMELSYGTARDLIISSGTEIRPRGTRGRAAEA